jgi:hypothetical protein
MPRLSEEIFKHLYQSPSWKPLEPKEIVRTKNSTLERNVAILEIWVEERIVM